MIEVDLSKATAHELRIRILEEFPARGGRLSPNELAGRLDERLTNTSYHVRMLLDLKCIELVETKQRRGALEHFYSLTEGGLIARSAARTIRRRVERVQAEAVGA